MHSSLFDELFGQVCVGKHVGCVGSSNTVLVAIDPTHFDLDCNALLFGPFDNFLAAPCAISNVIKRRINHDRVKWKLKS